MVISTNIRRLILDDYDDGFYDDMWEDTSHHYIYPSNNELENFDWEDNEDDDFIDEEEED